MTFANPEVGTITMRELLSHHSGAKHATAVFAPVSFLRPFRFCMEKRSFVKTGSVQALAGQLKQNGVCLHAGLPRLPGNLHGTPQVRKCHFLRQFYIKCIILPRQARDKHKENSKKCRFLAAVGGRRLRHYCSDRGRPHRTADSEGMCGNGRATDHSVVVGGDGGREDR